MTQTIDLAELVDHRGLGPRQWRIVVLCGLVALLDGLDLQAIGLAAPKMGPALHIDKPSFGLVFSAALAGLAVGAFLLGPVADRVGRKRVLVAATLGFGVFTLATSLATGFTDLMVYRFLTGVALGGAMPSFISLASEYVPRERRTTVVALLWAGFPLGGVVGGLIASHVIPAYGWRTLFVIGGVTPVVLAVVLLVLLPESAAFCVNRSLPTERVAATLRRVFPDVVVPGDARFTLPTETRGGASPRVLFADGRATGTVLLWVAGFFAFLVLVTNSSWSPTLLEDSGVAVPRSAVALALFNLGSLFGSAVAGALVARFGAARVLAPTLAGGAVAYALIGVAAPSVAGVVVVETAFGLLLGCASSGLIALAAISYPSLVRSTGVGWATAVARLGSFTGPLVVSAMVRGGRDAGEIFVVVGAATLIGALACLLMRSSPARVPSPVTTS